jgi:hypothetical protein
MQVARQARSVRKLRIDASTRYCYCSAVGLVLAQVASLATLRGRRHVHRAVIARVKGRQRYWSLGTAGAACSLTLTRTLSKTFARWLALPRVGSRYLTDRETSVVARSSNSRPVEMRSNKERVRHPLIRGIASVFVWTLAIGLLIVGVSKEPSRRQSMTRSNQSSDFVSPTMRAALQAGFFGSAMLVLYALTQDWWRGSAIAFAVGTLASLGAGAIGGGAGFLFALPRFGSTAAMQEFDEETRQSIKNDTASAVFTPSDNLVQISDWLTKLLIGAGLVQLGNIGRTLGPGPRRSLGMSGWWGRAGWYGAGMEQARASGIMGFSQPHDHGGARACRPIILDPVRPDRTGPR